MLAIVHNVTAATRLFDTLPLLAPDPRIRILFTRTGSSAFDNGTEEYLATRGVRSLSWRQALRLEYDLAISASYGGELHKINAPLMVMPHGMGYNKYLNKEQRTKNKEHGIRFIAGMAATQGCGRTIHHRPLAQRAAQ
ncbi:hypothetical protein [Nocardia cyriacigeorgica]|uniref:hypothetical protein n=1 Tax=Nocardia cyriacigeorgica TaxID=135487 RepID=UPI002456D7F5|nr:hypothetical protein [Nocardia cyriacigeorgica]